MPYILSPIIKENFQGLWSEGNPYKKETIYELDSGSPPVNYSAYTLKPHSLPHIEGSAHTQSEGKTIEQYFCQTSLRHFWGKTLVVKLKGNNFKPHASAANVKIWKVSQEELIAGIKDASGDNTIPERLILSLDELPQTPTGLHDPDHVLILSQAAADHLISNTHFCLYGTSWKSSDFQPGLKERPIHNTLFKSAVIMECLDLQHVPEGQYFMSAFPIPLESASESPVCPILYTKEEILDQFLK